MHLLLIVSFTPMALAVAVQQHIPSTTFKYSIYAKMPLPMLYNSRFTKNVVACATSVLLYADNQVAGINYHNGLCKVYTPKGKQAENIMAMFQRFPEVV